MSIRLVIAELGDGKGVAAVVEYSADVAMLDVEMPGLDGISAAAAVRKAAPNCRVLMVTTFGRPGYLKRAMQAGGVCRQGHPRTATGRSCAPHAYGVTCR